MRWLKGLMVVVVGLSMLGFAAQANADSIIVDDPVVSGVGPTWTFTYSANLFNSDLNPGDFFVIYDFRGYVGGSIFATPAVGSWTLSVQNSGPIPFQQTPVDSAAFPNLVFVYNGPAVSTGVLGVMALGTFGADTTVGAQVDANGNYSAEDTKLGTNLDQGNTGPVGIPVPLPAAAWGGLALLGLLGLRRRSA